LIRACDFNGIITLPNAALGTGNSPHAAVMAGINTALGSANVTVTSAAAGLQVWQVNLAGGTAAGTYVFINDGVAGASTSTDALIKVTLVGGAALAQTDCILFG
jgi:hypothetical protein